MSSNLAGSAIRRQARTLGQLATLRGRLHSGIMIRLFRRRATESTAASSSVRPLAAIADFSGTSIREAMTTPAYAAVLAYFAEQRQALMSDHSRAVLFSLIRMHRPQVVAEIGTLYAGTTEIMARALWENGAGIVYTTDPFGAERCPEIIATWPAELREVTRFYPLSSMDFSSSWNARRSRST